MKKIRLGFVAASLFVAATVPGVAMADDIGVGVGVSYVFGSQGGIAVGVKAFSNDEDNETVGSVGLDYIITSGAFRPNVGVSYQGEGYFGGADVGFNLNSQEVDFGLGGGWSNSDDDKKTPAPAAPVLNLT